MAKKSCICEIKTGFALANFTKLEITWLIILHMEYSPRVGVSTLQSGSMSCAEGLHFSAFSFRMKSLQREAHFMRW